MTSNFFFREKIPIECPFNSFFCKTEGVCINPLRVCDGQKNCLNGEDESNCSTFHFMKCTTTTKISINNICDHVENCPNLLDEYFCGKFKYFLSQYKFFLIS